MRRGAVGQPYRHCDIEVYHPRDDGHRLVLQLPNSEAANLKQTGESCWWPCNQSVVSGQNMDAIVCHQPSKSQQAVRCSLDEVED
jgi:hypothetical protein